MQLITKNKILIALCCGLLPGVGVGSVWSIPVVGAYIGVASALCMLVFSLPNRVRAGAEGIATDEQQKHALKNHILNSTFLMLLLPWLLLGFCIGLWRIGRTLEVPNQFERWMGEKQDFEGVVVTEPDVRQDKQLITIQPYGYTQRVLVTTTLSSRFQYGDRVWVRGKVVEAKAFDDFDYPGYLARFNTYALVRFPKAIVLSHHKANPIIDTLLQLKQILVGHLLKLYDSVQGNFLLGILIGAKRGLPQEVTNNFIRTGTSHVLAASGFNISIFITWLACLAYAIGRRAQMTLSVLCIFAFVVIAGPTASVVRAACMGVMLMLGQFSGRLYNPLTGLLFVAAGMVLLNPRILYWDIGFQLSAAATCGILLGVPLFSALKEKVGGWYTLCELLGITLCAICSTLPVSLWRFGELSTIAPVANILIVPPVETVMALGFLSFVPFVGPGFAWINSHILGCMLKMEQLLATPSWAIAELHISGAYVCISYVALGVGYLSVRRALRRSTLSHKLAGERMN